MGILAKGNWDQQKSMTHIAEIKTSGIQRYFVKDLVLEKNSIFDL